MMPDEYSSVSSENSAILVLGSWYKLRRVVGIDWNLVVCRLLHFWDLRFCHQIILEIFCFLGNILPYWGVEFEFSLWSICRWVLCAKLCQWPSWCWEKLLQFCVVCDYVDDVYQLEGGIVFGSEAKLYWAYISWQFKSV